MLYAVPYVGALATALVTFLVAFAAGGAGFAGVAVALVVLLNQAFDNVVSFIKGNPTNIVNPGALQVRR